jgi:hypothetical protein
MSCNDDLAAAAAADVPPREDDPPLRKLDDDAAVDVVGYEADARAGTEHSSRSSSS